MRNGGPVGPPLCFWVVLDRRFDLRGGHNAGKRLPKIGGMMDQRDSVAGLPKARRFGFPSAYTILFVLIFFAAALTWIMPAGQYTRVQDPALGREIALRGSYHPVTPNPQTLVDAVKAPVAGFYDGATEKTRAVDVALFVLFVGGFMGVVNRTGAIDVAMVGTMRALAGREHWMIPILMALFALGGTTIGMEEEAVPLLALLVPLMLRAGYDSVVAVAIVLVGTAAGRFGSTINPFFTGIASNAAGISFTEGLGLRVVMLILAWLASTAWVMRYAARVRRNGSTSLLADRNAAIRAHFHTDSVPAAGLSRRQVLVLALFALTFGVLIAGVGHQGWWMTEMSALFLGSAIIIATVAGIGEKSFVESFVDGARDLLGVALIVGLARGVLVVMNDGRITDTLLHAGEAVLHDLSATGFLIGILCIDALMAIVVPSASGLSVLTTPIFAPLADFAGVPRSLIVTALQSGANITGLFAPTQAATMGMLAIGQVPYQRWLRFVWPLALIYLGIGVASLSIASIIGEG